MPATPPALPARRDLLVLFLALSALTLGVGGRLTALGFGPWYDALEKPPFQPPAWAFGPAWTTIMTLLAIGTWQVARRRDEARGALRLYALQLALNVAWSLLFFTLHRPGWALVDIVVLDLVVLAMVARYGRVHRPSSWCLVPYAVWLALATAINAWIVLRN
jgi:tryptophan-rich sensory protein